MLPRGYRKGGALASVRAKRVGGKARRGGLWWGADGGRISNSMRGEGSVAAARLVRPAPRRGLQVSGGFGAIAAWRLGLVRN
jgi:hypothetical protein